MHQHNIMKLTTVHHYCNKLKMTTTLFKVVGKGGGGGESVFKNGKCVRMINCKNRMTNMFQVANWFSIYLFNGLTKLCRSYNR